MIAYISGPMTGIHDLTRLSENVFRVVSPGGRRFQVRGE